MLCKTLLLLANVLAVTIMAGLVLSVSGQAAAVQRRQVLQHGTPRSTFALTAGDNPATLLVADDPFKGKIIWMDPSGDHTDQQAKLCAKITGDPLCQTCTQGPGKPSCTSCITSTASPSDGITYTLNNGVCSLKLTWEEFTAVTDGFCQFLGTYGGLHFASDPAPGEARAVVGVCDSVTRWEPGTIPSLPGVDFNTFYPAATSGIHTLTYSTPGADRTSTLSIAPATGPGHVFRPVSVNVFHWRNPATVTFSGRLGGKTLRTLTVNLPHDTTTAVLFPPSFPAVEELSVKTVATTDQFFGAYLLMDDFVYAPVPFQQPKLSPGQGNNDLADPFKGKTIWMDFTERKPNAQARQCAKAVGDQLCQTCTQDPAPACTSCISSSTNTSTSINYTLNNGVCSLKLTFEEFTDVTIDGGLYCFPAGIYGGLRFVPANMDLRLQICDVGGMSAVFPQYFGDINTTATSGTHSMGFTYPNIAGSTGSFSIFPNVGSAGLTLKPISISMQHRRGDANVTFDGMLQGKLVSTFTAALPEKNSISVAFPSSFPAVDELKVTIVCPRDIELYSDDLVYVPIPK